MNGSIEKIMEKFDMLESWFETGLIAKREYDQLVEKLSHDLLQELEFRTGSK